MPFYTILSGILITISIAGAILNAMGKRWGFLVWITSNLGWIYYNILTNTIEQIPLWVVYTMISWYGYIKWNRGETIE